MGTDMNGEDMVNRSGKGRRRGTIAFVSLAACVVLALVLWFFAWHWPDPERSVRRFQKRYYRQHPEEERLFQRFKPLAEKKGWRMYARDYDCVHSLGVFDFARFTYEALYSPPAGRWIESAAGPCEGRIAFIECTPRGPVKPKVGEFALCILDKSGDVRKVRLENEEFEWRQRIEGDFSLSPGQQCVLLASRARAYLYDLPADSLRMVHQFNEGEWLYSCRRTFVVRTDFLILLFDAGDSKKGMLVLDASAPYGTVSRLEPLTNATVVGGHLVIEKDRQCSLYQPRSNEITPLCQGTVVTALTDRAFLFQKRDDTLYEYDIQTRSERFVPGGPGRVRDLEVIDGYHIGDTRIPLPSPDRLFLFVPWRKRIRESFPAGWDVYDLVSGEKSGMFLEPHVKGRFLELLGWVEDK